MANTQHEPQMGDKGYNIFRHSFLRYAGYANEVGESFRYQFPRFVGPSYAFAFGYCLADASWTGYSTYQSERNTKHQVHDTVRATVDTLVWQSLASVAIPGFTINMIVKTSRSAVKRVAVPILVADWLPTAIGLGSIPFIIYPIDYSVDYVMDSTVRDWWKPIKTNDSL
jgi:fission process protein 1